MRLENDVNLAALGELHFGKGRTDNNFCYVNVGTGLGMGIVLEGRLIRGQSGAAGEIGFMPLGAGVNPDLKAQAGELEAAIGSNALSARYEASSGQKLTVKEIFERFEAGDDVARTVVDESALTLARALGCIKAILDVKLFVLGGGIGRNNRFAECLRSAARFISGEPVTVEQTGLTGAGAQGAKVEALGMLFDVLFRFQEAGQAIPDMKPLIEASKSNRRLELTNED